MVEPGEGAGFGQVRLDVLGPGDPLGVGDLDRHGAVEVVVVGEVDPPEPARAEEPPDPVAPDRLGERPRPSPPSPGFSGSSRVS